MASRIMHLAIGYLVKQKFDFGDRFLYGNLIPDAHGQSFSTKEKTHFMFCERDRAENRFVDYDRFITKYKEKINDELYLGYYCHLISDDIWLRDIFLKYIPDSSNPNRQSILKKYYEDFYRLNSILINKYNINYRINSKSNYQNIINEIDTSLIYDKIIIGLENDYNKYQGSLELELLNIDDIYRFITDSTDLAIELIEKL